MVSNQNSSPWTDERVAFVRERAGEGQSASVIAHELGPSFTRNAVIGICKRKGIGLKGRLGRTANGTSSSACRRREKEQRKQPLPRMTDAERIADKIAKALAAQPAEDEALPESRPTAIYQLRSSDCRWPLGFDADGQRLFCCADQATEAAEHDCPYCLTHYAMAIDWKRSRRARVAA
jgi:hypothetical protein